MADHAFISFEQVNVHRVEADDGDVEADVDFGDLRSKVARASVGGEMLFDFIKVSEEVVEGGFVGWLGGGKTALAFSKFRICIGTLWKNEWTY